MPEAIVISKYSHTGAAALAFREALVHVEAARLETQNVLATSSVAELSLDGRINAESGTYQRIMITDSQLFAMRCVGVLCLF